MGIQETSIEAYQAIKPELGLRQRQVLLELTKQDLTNFQLSKRLNLPINSITPRVKELREKGMVIDRGTVLCSETGRRVILWGIPLGGGQLNLL